VTLPSGGFKGVIIQKKGGGGKERVNKITVLRCGVGPRIV